MTPREWSAVDGCVMFDEGLAAYRLERGQRDAEAVAAAHNREVAELRAENARLLAWSLTRPSSAAHTDGDAPGPGAKGIAP